jgi:uncharacterized protein YktA (UPF0223 family)
MSIKETFSYPIDERWSTDELTDVIDFFAIIEKAYQEGVKREKFVESYRKFQQVVPNKSEEKRLFREFLSNSGMEPFLAVKQLKDPEIKKVRVIENENRRQK